MLRAQHFFPDCQRALIQGFRLCILAFCDVKRGKVVQHRCYSRVRRAQRFFSDCQRALIQAFSLYILALDPIKLSNIVQALCHIRMRRALRSLGISVLSMTPFLGLDAAADNALLEQELGLPALPPPSDWRRGAEEGPP